MVESSTVVAKGADRPITGRGVDALRCAGRSRSMPDWQSRKHLEDHFADQGREVGARTAGEYDSSARALIVGDDVVEFAYEDWETNLTCLGIFGHTEGRGP